MRDGRVATTVAPTPLACAPVPSCTVPRSVTWRSSASVNRPVCGSIDTVSNSWRTSCESDGGSTSATSSSVESVAHSGGAQLTCAPGRFGEQPTAPATSAASTRRVTWRGT